MLPLGSSMLIVSVYNLLDQLIVSLGISEAMFARNALMDTFGVHQIVYLLTLEVQEVQDLQGLQVPQDRQDLQDRQDRQVLQALREVQEVQLLQDHLVLRVRLQQFQRGQLSFH